MYFTLPDFANGVSKPLHLMVYTKILWRLQGLHRRVNLFGEVITTWCSLRLGRKGLIMAWLLTKETLIAAPYVAVVCFVTVTFLHLYFWRRRFSFHAQRRDYFIGHGGKTFIRHQLLHPPGRVSWKVHSPINGTRTPRRVKASQYYSGTLHQIKAQFYQTAICKLTGTPTESSNVPVQHLEVLTNSHIQVPLTRISAPQIWIFWLILAKQQETPYPSKEHKTLAAYGNPVTNALNGFCRKSANGWTQGEEMIWSILMSWGWSI